MGLKSFSGDFPALKDIGIAKNYLSEEELKILNNIVSGYFDFAEIQAMRHNPMYMSDYIEHLDNVLKTTGEKLLYKKYQVQNLSPVEEEYLESIKNIHSTAKKKILEPCGYEPLGSSSLDQHWRWKFSERFRS